MNKKIDKFNRGEIHIIKTNYMNTLPKKFAIYIGTYYTSLKSAITTANIAIILSLVLGFGFTKALLVLKSLEIAKLNTEIITNMFYFNNILYPITFAFIGIYISIDKKIKQSLNTDEFKELKSNSEDEKVIKISKIFSYLYISFLYMTVVQLIVDTSIVRYLLIIPLLYYIQFIFRGIHKIKDCKVNYKSFIIILNIAIIGAISYFFKINYEVKPLLPSWLVILIGLIFVFIAIEKTSKILDTLFVVSKDSKTHINPLEAYISPTVRELLKREAINKAVEKPVKELKSFETKKKVNKEEQYLTEEEILGKRLRADALESYRNQSRPEYQHITKKSEIDEAKRVFGLDEKVEAAKLNSKTATEIRESIEEELSSHKINKKTDVSVDRINAKR